MFLDRNVGLHARLFHSHTGTVEDMKYTERALLSLLSVFMLLALTVPNPCSNAKPGGCLTPEQEPRTTYSIFATSLNGPSPQPSSRRMARWKCLARCSPQSSLRRSLPAALRHLSAAHAPLGRLWDAQPTPPTRLLRLLLYRPCWAQCGSVSSPWWAAQEPQAPVDLPGRLEHGAERYHQVGLPGPGARPHHHP